MIVLQCLKNYLAHQNIGSTNDMNFLLNLKNLEHFNYVVHERYALRPIAIDNICLAQFATLYETCSKISAKAVLFANNTRGESTHKLICSDIRDVFLPNYIKLSDETYMKI